MGQYRKAMEFMAFERKWLAVVPQLLTADGGTLGQIQVADTRGFKVGMIAVISAVGQPDLQVQVKRVMSATLLLVGPIGSPYASAQWTNASAYTVAAGAYVYAESQPKSKVPANDRDEATYETEPTVAWRTIMVDQLGQYYEAANPLPVTLKDVEIIVENLAVQLTSKDNDPKPGDIHDSIRIGDQNNELAVNPGGSINVVVLNSAPTTASAVISAFGVAAAVPSGATTTIVAYTCPPAMTSKLQRINGSGDNIGKYTVLLNGVAFDTRRTNFGGDLNALFDYTTGTADEYTLVAGDVLTLQILHTRPYIGDFEGRIQMLEVDV